MLLFLLQASLSYIATKDRRKFALPSLDEASKPFTEALYQMSSWHAYALVARGLEKPISGISV